MKREVFVVFILVSGQYTPAYKTDTLEQAELLASEFEQYKIIRFIDEIIDL